MKAPDRKTTGPLIPKQAGSAGFYILCGWEVEGVGFTGLRVCLRGRPAFVDQGLRFSIRDLLVRPASIVVKLRFQMLPLPSEAHLIGCYSGRLATPFDRQTG